MKSVAGLIFGAAVVFAEEGLKDGEVDGVKGGDTEGEKQFFGSGFRRFYIRPFPLPTNHYPSGTTVANAYSARVIADRWLAAQNQDQEERVLALVSDGFFVKNNGQKTEDFKSLKEGFACPFSWTHGGCTAEDVEEDLTGDDKCHSLYTVETSFTAKSDGFIAEYEYHDRDNNSGRCVYEASLLSLQVNRYGKAINARYYRANTNMNCDDDEYRGGGEFERRAWDQGADYC
jgi:hypothetical protein